MCSSALGFQLNPSEAQAKDLPGSGDAIAGRDRLAAAGISPGAIKPFVVLVEHGRRPAPIAAKLRATQGIAGASRRRPGLAQGRRRARRGVPDRPRREQGHPRHDLARHEGRSRPAGSTLGGVAPEDRDFVHAVYGNFPYVLLFVVLLTYVLLARAFRSLCCR